jgi:hypothetical protein
MKRLLVILICLAALPLAGCTPAQKRDWKDAGRAVKGTGKEVGRAVSEAGTEVGDAVSGAAKDVAEGTEKVVSGED